MTNEQPNFSPPPAAVRLPTREAYDLWATIYDDEDNPLVVLEESHIRRLLPDVDGLQVLDAGCGTGRHSLLLSQAGAEVTAIDFSESMLAKARAKPGADQVQFRHHDLSEPFPFDREQFDRVISTLVVDHIADLAAFFAELRRVCRPDGTVVVTVMHPAMMLRGAQARFTDPETGALTLPASEQHEVSDYVMAAVQSGLSIASMSEHLVDEDLASKSERARRYLGWPMLLVLELTP